MRASYGIATEIVDYGDGAPDVRCDSGAGGWDWSQHHTLDINHPATKGWLLHWLMESGRLHSVTPDGVFVDQEDRDLKPLWFPNEAAALLAVWGDAA